VPIGLSLRRSSCAIPSQRQTYYTDQRLAANNPHHPTAEHRYGATKSRTHHL